LHRQHPQGRQARRPAGAAVDQIPVRHQSANGAGARHRGAAGAALYRRRGDRMRRREFITSLGGAAAWAIAAHAEQAERMRHIGVLMNLSEDDPTSKPRIAAFLQGLQQLNWTVDHNLKIDIRWGAADAARARKDAAELVALGPDVILAAT